MKSPTNRTQRFLTLSSFAAAVAAWMTFPSCPLFAADAAAATPEISSRIVGKNYAERCAAFTRYLANAKPSNPNFPKEATTYYAARLQLGVDLPGTVKAIDKMIDATLKAKPDPFNLHAVMHVYQLHKSHFTPAMRDKVKRLAASWDYSKPIGVSMNYELMRDGSGWLAAQEWPDLVDKAGNNAEKVKKNCEGWLMRIFRETPINNSSEYDAPIYYGTDFAPCRMVAEFSKDAALSKAAQMTLDFMLIQTAAHWHHGYHISTAGRGKYWGSLNLSPDAAAPTNGMAFLFFGADRPFNLASAPQAYWLAHPGKTLPIDWLPAWQAALPDDRTVLANQLWAGHKTFVRKMAWFTKGYGLASQREDESPFSCFLFKECRRTMLKWVSDKPASSFTLLQENRRRPNEKIANAFAYGENPYCQTLQQEGTLIGVYDVPEDYGYWITRAPFVKSGAIVLRQERDGWVLCHGGSMVFAFRFTQPAIWDKPNTRENLDLLKCDAKRCGWILETAPIATFAGGGAEAELKKFGDALVAKTKISNHTDVANPKLTFTNLSGHTLDIQWKPLQEPLKDQCKIDGKPLDPNLFPLLKAPGVLQPTNGPMTLKLPNGMTRVYDFKKFTVTESKQP